MVEGRAGENWWRPTGSCRGDFQACVGAVEGIMGGALSVGGGVKNDRCRDLEPVGQYSQKRIGRSCDLESARQYIQYITVERRATTRIDVVVPVRFVQACKRHSDLRCRAQSF
jgi:hypothetical protein